MEPSKEQLGRLPQRNIKCPTPGCGSTLPHESALRLHLVKVHRVIENQTDFNILHRRQTKTSPSIRYHCPTEGCKYNKALGRSFTSMKLLKQHYLHVHAERQYHCTRCESRYAIERDLRRHEQTCQTHFVCSQCSKVYNSRNSLINHCRRATHKSNIEGINSEVFAKEAQNACTVQPSSNAKGKDIALDVGNKSHLAPANITENLCKNVDKTPNPSEIEKIATKASQDNDRFSNDDETHIPGTDHRRSTSRIIPETLPSESHIPIDKTDPKSLVMNLLQGDAFKNWSCEVQLGATPSLVLRSEANRGNGQSNDSFIAGESNNKNDESSKMRDSIQNLQKTVETLSSMEESAIAAPLKASMSNVVSDMKIELESLRKSLQIIEGNSVRIQQKQQPKSRMLLPMPDTVVLPVNLNYNGSLSSGVSHPIVFVCNTRAAPRNRSLANRHLLPRPSNSNQMAGYDKNPPKDKAIQTEVNQICNPHSFDVSIDRHSLVQESALMCNHNPPSAITSSSHSVNGTQTLHTDALPPRDVNTSNGNSSRKRKTNNTKSYQPKKRCIESQTAISKNRKSRGRGRKSKATEHSSNQHVLMSRIVDSDPSFAQCNPVSSTLDISTCTRTLNLAHLNSIQTQVSPTIGFQDNYSSSSISVGKGSRVTDQGTNPVPGISVGTMPSPSFMSAADADLDSVTFSTRGTDPLPGCSALDDNESLSLFSSQQTQTSLWKQWEDSIMAESNSTQTMESYLNDSSAFTIPTFIESGVQASNAQHTHTQTLFNDPNLSQSKSIGVGTSLISDQSPLLETVEQSGESRSVGIDTQLFDDLFPEVSSRSVALSTPLFDGNMTINEETSSVTSTFQPIEQCTVSIGLEKSSSSMYDIQSNDNDNVVNLDRNDGNSAPTLRYDSIATASVQTDTEKHLRSFLTSASQTTDFSSSTNMETQTVSDMFSQLLSNMETQTSSDILAGLDFVDIETQTPRTAQGSNNVETQTGKSNPNSLIMASNVGSQLLSDPGMRDSSVFVDNETQTFLPVLHLNENSFTDSHTQTALSEFESLVDQLEKR